MWLTENRCTFAASLRGEKMNLKATGLENKPEFDEREKRRQRKGNQKRKKRKKKK